MLMLVINKSTMTSPTVALARELAREILHKAALSAALVFSLLSDIV